MKSGSGHRMGRNDLHRRGGGRAPAVVAAASNLSLLLRRLEPLLRALFSALARIVLISRFAAISAGQ